MKTLKKIIALILSFALITGTIMQPSFMVYASETSNKTDDIEETKIVINSITGLEDNILSQTIEKNSLDDPVLPKTLDVTVEKTTEIETDVLDTNTNEPTGEKTMIPIVSSVEETVDITWDSVDFDPTVEGKYSGKATLF